jgi:hypothetical protein
VPTASPVPTRRLATTDHVAPGCTWQPDRRNPRPAHLPGSRPGRVAHKRRSRSQCHPSLPIIGNRKPGTWPTPRLDRPP